MDSSTVRSQVPGPETALGLPSGYRWFFSSGRPLAEPWPDPPPPLARLEPGDPWLRLIGLTAPAQPEPPIASEHPGGHTAVIVEVLEDDEYSPSPETSNPRTHRPQGQLSLTPASGPRDIPLAIIRALADYFGLPFNRDAVNDQIDAFLQRQQQLNLINLGQILDTLGLKVLLSRIPLDRLTRVPLPVVLEQNGRFGLLDGIDSLGNAHILEAEMGLLEVPINDLATTETGEVELLLLERKIDAKERRFGWSWYLPYLKNHRRAFIEVLVTSFLANGLKLVPVLGILVLVQQVVPSRSVGALVSICALILLAAFVEGIVNTLRSFIFIDTANRIDQATKSTILDHLLRLPQGYFDTRPVGGILFYLAQMDRLRDFLLGKSITTVVDSIFGLFFLVVLLFISPLLTIISLGTSLPFLIALSLATQPIVRDQLRGVGYYATRVYTLLSESITGIQTIKSQNAELKTIWEFQNRYSDYIGKDFQAKITQQALVNASQFIGNINQVLVMGIGIWLLIDNQINMGEFMAFRMLSSQVTGPLLGLVNTIQDFREAASRFELIGDLVNFKTEQTIAESQNIPMPPLLGHVKFIDVTFRFNEATPMILQGVNLEIPAGAFVGLVGGSGSGKSTLLKLLPRFYRPAEGTVLIDGLDIGKVELYSLRRQIGVVPQDSVLFDGTVRENLLLVKPDATVQEMIRACRIACAHDFIMEMPQGYNSKVGERGAGLSGGQRQRLALARAVLQNPRMLILDEATSALDASTERQVCINLFEAFRGRTVFFITHRLSTVRPADCIVLMNQGAVMEVGSHHQLMDLRGWYYALHRSQSQEEMG